MSLNRIYLVFMDFDRFRNISLVHQGIYSFSIRNTSSKQARIMFCNSNPCTKCNIRHNVQIEDAELYYKPSTVDVVENAFVSRNVLIRYTGEEASLRDSCCWRIEVPYDEVNELPLSFQIDLYSKTPIKRDNRVIAYSEKPVLLGSQTITIGRLSSDASLNYIRLLFPQQGLCEITGVMTCSLVDMRYNPVYENLINQEGEDGGEEDENFGCCLKKHRSLGDYLFSNCDSYLAIAEKASSIKDDLCVQFEGSFYRIANCMQSIHKQYGLKGVDIEEEYTPFKLPSKWYSTATTTTTLLKSSTLPLPSTSPPPHPMNDLCGSPRLHPHSPTIHESLSCGELTTETPMICSVSKGEGDEEEECGFCGNENNENNEDAIFDGLSEIRKQVADEIMIGIRDCTKQIWQIHDQLVEKVQSNIGEIVEILAANHAKSLSDYCNRFVLQSKLSMHEVGGELRDVLVEHRGMFTTVHESKYYEQLQSGWNEWNDTLYHTFSDHTPLLLVEQFSQQRTPTSPRTPEMRKKRWQCSNPKCKTWCSGVSGRCTACLTNREERDHVVFLLHGFNASPSDMRYLINHLQLTYPHLHLISLQSLAQHTQESLLSQSSRISSELHSHLQSLQHPVTRISFIAHSLGALVLRLALNSPLFTVYRDRFHLFLSLNTPHLGVVFPGWTTEWGSKFVSFFNNSKVLSELLLKDANNLRNTLLYKMARNSGLDAFRYIFLVSSHQDTFVPFHSERAETTPSIRGTRGLESEIYQEMVDGFWTCISQSPRNIHVKKFDVCYENIAVSLDSFIGKTAHNNVLRDANVIQMLLVQCAECFV